MSWLTGASVEIENRRCPTGQLPVLRLVRLLVVSAGPHLEIVCSRLKLIRANSKLETSRTIMLVAVDASIGTATAR